ncbi:MAG: MBL fold metallo-hydrolase [Alphaproteobacteria bacterium]
MSSALTITMLGCGTSVGIPCLGRAGWGTCDPNEPKNRRQRCALLVRSETTTILVDAGPDIRNQLLPHELEKIDAVLITHTHSDHVAGIDDLRVFYWPDRTEVPVYASAKHGVELTERVPYLFSKDPTSPSYFIPPFTMQEIAADDMLKIGDISIDVLHQEHGGTFSFGFIFNDFCGYSTDVKEHPEINFEKLANIPLWIVESLREQEHQAHADYATTFSWIERVKPKRAVLTHLGLEADYQTLYELCPEGVEPGYDGMTFHMSCKSDGL